ncbi:complement component C8 gamma chain isoform X2 [Cyrtonyx montezumae]|uniref:complement component C8 gamma chain isoform X2 n=1 Tax=Cyrtonyx montezumae TaxID=9017 RepID=UPI0032DBBAA9
MGCCKQAGAGPAPGCGLRVGRVALEQHKRISGMCCTSSLYRGEPGTLKATELPSQSGLGAQVGCRALSRCVAAPKPSAQRLLPEGPCSSSTADVWLSVDGCGMTQGWAVLGDQAALRPCRGPRALLRESPRTVPSLSPPGHGYKSKMEVVVGETDPHSYAIIYYQDSQGLSVKLYGRRSQLSDAIVDKFEQRARAMGLSEDMTYYFPTYETEL